MSTGVLLLVIVRLIRRGGRWWPQALGDLIPETSEALSRPGDRMILVTSVVGTKRTCRVSTPYVRSWGLNGPSSDAAPGPSLTPSQTFHLIIVRDYAPTIVTPSIWLSIGSTTMMSSYGKWIA
jgi:hypothetical protein